MAGGTAMIRRARVAVGAAPAAGLPVLAAGVDAPLVELELANGLTSTAVLVTALHLDGGGARSGLAVRLALPTAAMRGPAALDGAAAGASSSTAPKAARRAATGGRDEVAAGFLRVVGAKRRAADQAAAAGGQLVSGSVALPWALGRGRTLGFVVCCCRRSGRVGTVGERRRRSDGGSRRGGSFCCWLGGALEADSTVQRHACSSARSSVRSRSVWSSSAGDELSLLVAPRLALNSSHAQAE